MKFSDEEGTGLVRVTVGVCVLLLLLRTGPLSVVKPADSSFQEKLPEFRGKIIVLNFWASWCEPCLREIPILMQVQREFESRGVQFLGACIDEAEDRGRAEEILRKNGVTYPSWFEPSEKEMKALGLGSSIPATAIFDREGKRIFRLVGDIKKKQLVERLEWLLGKQDGRSPKELLLPAGMDPSEYQGH